MKQKLLNLRALLMLMVLSFATGAWAEEVTITWSDYAAENSWENGVAQSDFTVSNLTFTVSGGGNNGKYYTSDTTWRFYAGGGLKITPAEGYAITAVSSNPTQTFTIENGVASTSFAATVKFKSITVTYSVDEGGETPVEKISTTTSFSGGQSSYEITLGDTFTAPTAAVTGGVGLLPTYSSSNTAVATVDATSGVVTVIGVGTTTIKASYAGDDTYAASSASYTLKVNAPVVSYASLEELVAADVTSGTIVTVTFENVAIKDFYKSGSYTNGVFLGIQKGGKDIEIYYRNVPADWVVGGTLSGTMTCPWKNYNGTWELAPDANTWDWNNLTYTAPENPKQTPIITATIPESLELGKDYSFDVSYDGDGALSVGSSKTAVATATISGKTITVTPVAAGTTTITISAPETENYYAAEKKYTLDVTAPVVPAELPFSFDGGKDDIANTQGMSQKGLGSDYSASPKLKFDTTGDEVVINFNGQAKELKYTIKGNGFTGNAFDVLESADGNEYTTIKRYTSLSTTENESFVLKAESRYVKFIYTDKNAGNVALGKIQITKGGTLSDPEFAFENTSYTFFTTNEEMKVKAESKKGSAGKITYALTEGDEDAFAIDENTGDIVCETAGLYKVTATIAETSEYYSATATCTVKIIEPIVTNSIIVAGTPKGHFAMKTTMGDGKYFESIQVYKAGDKYVTIGNLDDILFATNETEGKVTIQNAEGLYVQATGAKAVGYTENAYEWSVNEEGVLTAANTAYGTLQYNTSSPRFTTYASKTGQYATISTSYAEGYVRDITLAEGQEEKWGTICLDRTIEAADLAGATFYSIAGKRTGANGDVSVLVLEEETEGLLAGYPYIFSATSNVVAAYTGDVEETTAKSYNGLVGSLGGCSVETGMYLISNNKVVKCGTGCSIAANRAYINMADVPEYTESSSAKVVELSIEGGDATGINIVDANINANEPIYNIAGQRVNANAKGILIQNGKKYFNK